MRLQLPQVAMAEADDRSDAEKGRDGLLACVHEIRAMDSANAVAQVLEEMRPEARSSCVSWQDVINKINNQEYTTYGMLHQDVQTVISVLSLPDKKRSRLQKTCAKVMKDMRRHWGMSEVSVRMHLFAWHPEGPAKASQVCMSNIEKPVRFAHSLLARSARQMLLSWTLRHAHVLCCAAVNRRLSLLNFELLLQDEAAFREKCEAHLREFRASARTAQVYAAFIDHPAQKMGEMGELAVGKLQATQHIASTDDYDADVLAVHSDLEAALPAWTQWPQEDLDAAAVDDASAPRPTSTLAQMPAVTVVVRFALHPCCKYVTTCLCMQCCIVCNAAHAKALDLAQA